jgi:hypothetical protein
MGTGSMGCRRTGTPCLCMLETRNRLGQSVRVSDPDGTAQLSNVIETLDLAGGRAALDYQIENAGFMQHRQEVLTSHHPAFSAGDRRTRRSFCCVATSLPSHWPRQTRRPRSRLRTNRSTGAH